MAACTTTRNVKVSPGAYFFHFPGSDLGLMLATRRTGSRNAALGLAAVLFIAACATPSSGPRDAVPAAFVPECLQPGLETRAARYVLRRRDGPAYADQTLRKLVGCNVECDGIVVSYVLIADRIEPISEAV